MKQKFIETLLFILEKSVLIQSVLFIVSTFIVFAPDTLLERIYLSHSNISGWLPFVSLIMLITGIALVVMIIKKVWVWGRNRLINIKRDKQRLRELKELAEEEKIVLYVFLISKLPSMNIGGEPVYFKILSERGYLQHSWVHGKYSLDSRLKPLLIKHCNDIFYFIAGLSDDELKEKFHQIIRRYR